MPNKTNIPVFILAGGMGTRISEETSLRPKPMIEIGEIPILLHLMRWYYSFGFTEFVICAGYRSWEIKEYFLTYEFRRNHLRIDHREATNFLPMTLGKNSEQENWRVDIIDTGVESMTGARLARALDELSRYHSFSNFALTYGDGLSDINLEEELKFHLSHGRIGTVLGVPPAARWGELDISSDMEVEGFLEKPEARAGLINGGFFFFRREFRDFLSAQADCVLERAPLTQLSAARQLMVYKHTGFWHPMDTLRDKYHLQSIWDSGKAPWKSDTTFGSTSPVQKEGADGIAPTSETVGHA